MDAVIPNRKTMNRFEIIQRAVSRLRVEEAVIGGIGNTNFDLWGAGQRPQDFFMLGSMGLAFPIALGVALAQPQRNVVGLEGDGSLLMQVGCLATIAAVAPPNLTLVLFDNGMYQITGGQKTATWAWRRPRGDGARSRALQQRLGGRRRRFRGAFRAGAERAGPCLIGIGTDYKKAVAVTDRDPPRLRHAFMQGIGKG